MTNIVHELPHDIFLRRQLCIYNFDFAAELDLQFQAKLFKKLVPILLHRNLKILLLFLSILSLHFFDNFYQEFIPPFDGHFDQPAFGCLGYLKLLEVGGEIVVTQPLL